MPQPGVDAPAGEGEELPGEAAKAFLGRDVVPAVQLGQEVSDGISTWSASIVFLRRGSLTSGRELCADIWSGPD